jgi:hypothetical protein
MAHKAVAVPPKIVMTLATFPANDTVRIRGENIQWWGWRTFSCHQALHRLRFLGHGGLGRGLRSESGRRQCAESAGAVVGEGGSGVAGIGEDGPGGDIDGSIRGNGDVMGDCWGDRAEGRGDPWRGERRSVSPFPSPLNSSASHRLLTTFLVRFAGSGEGIGE